MKLKKILTSIVLCTVLNFSNGYTSDNSAIQPEIFNDICIPIQINDNECAYALLYTSSTKNISGITKVHTEFDNPNSEEVEVTNNNGFFEFKSKRLEECKEYLSKSYSCDATYGIVEYNGYYYTVLLTDNQKVNGKVWSKLIFYIKQGNDTLDYPINTTTALLRLPLQYRLTMSDYDLEDKVFGTGHKLFLCRKNDDSNPYADGPMTFYPYPKQNFQKRKVRSKFVIIPDHIVKQLENKDSRFTTIFNNNGEFDIENNTLQKESNNSVNSNPKKYGIIKYNGEYYLVGYYVKTNNLGKVIGFYIFADCKHMSIDDGDTPMDYSYCTDYSEYVNDRLFLYFNKNVCNLSKLDSNHNNDFSDEENVNDNISIINANENEIIEENYNDDEEYGQEAIYNINQINEINNMDENNGNNINEDEDLYNMDDNKENNISNENNEIPLNNYNLINNDNNIKKKEELENNTKEIYTRLLNEITNNNKLLNKVVADFVDTGINALYTNKDHEKIRNTLINNEQLNQRQIDEVIKYIKFHVGYFIITNDTIKYLSDYFRLRNQLDNLQ